MMTTSDKLHKKSNGQSRKEINIQTFKNYQFLSPILKNPYKGLFRSKLPDKKTALGLQNCQRSSAQVDGKINKKNCLGFQKVWEFVYLGAQHEQTLRPNSYKKNGLYSTLVPTL